MIRTRICDLLEIDHPIALGGMPFFFNPPELVAAVSESGGIGAYSATQLNPDQIRDSLDAIRSATEKPFALNFLMFMLDEDCFSAALELGPPVISFAWPGGDQILKPYVDRAHAAGCKVMFMAGTVAEARRGAEAGADVIIAQGTEGGGHVSWIGTSVLVPMIVEAVSPIPVMAAGGIANGRGFVAALVLGAEGVLLGTRFLASEESNVHPNYKAAIVASDGHDTMLTEIPDIAAGQIWPGAMSRVSRNRFIERWAGREWALRENAAEARAGVQAAREIGDPEEAPLFFGQDAGLIDAILPAKDIVRQMAEEAEEIITHKLTALIR